MIALIVLVIHLAVQKLDVDRHAVVLSDSFDPVQALHAVGDGFFIAHPAAVAEERDHVRRPLGFGTRNQPFEVGDDRVVIGLTLRPSGIEPPPA